MAYQPNTPNRISTTLFNSRDSATLAAAATFQGTGEDVSKYGRVGVSITSTTATATGVLTMEVSHDGVTYSGPTRTWKTFDAPFMWNIVEKYFRIKFVNDSVEAADLSIQVQYSNNADIVLAHQINEILPKDTEGQTVRPTNDFALDTARIHIMGQKAEFLFGANEAVGNAAWEDIWPVGGDVTWLTVASKVEIISSHIDDNGTTPGPGLRSVSIDGLDATGAFQEEVILTNGTAAVESALTYIRVNIVHSEKGGTYGGSHRGDITCRVTGGGATMAIMKGIEEASGTSVQYGGGESKNGFYTVPLGKVIYLTKLQVIIEAKANVDVSVALYEREDILDIGTASADVSPLRILWDEELIKANLTHVFKSHQKVKSLADIWFRAKADSGSANVAITLDYYEVDADVNGA